MKSISLIGVMISSAFLTACATPFHADMVISSNQVYVGNTTQAQALDIAICGNEICAVTPKGSQTYATKNFLDVGDQVVSPGFIDPHTHSLAELESKTANANLNYLTQGVTTVVNGNDGGGPFDIAKTKRHLESKGIGTNTAFFVGHNTVRRHVMGSVERAASPSEIDTMKSLVKQAMQEGAFGLSSGLYYVPGNFAATDEVVELAKVAAQYNGIYETHLRDESTFNIGFLRALEEALEIGKKANIPVHLAHLKALGVDVWGQSRDAVKLIEAAQKNGQIVTADQYPWLASGTSIRGALVPQWVRADSQQAMVARLDDQKQKANIAAQISENIRRRGGAERVLITVTERSDLVGKTLADIAHDMALTPTEAVMQLIRGPRLKIASFNMSEADVEHFMVQPWVVSSSDGSDGHPRKYASFPQKYTVYVKQKKLLTLAQFINRSSYATAQLLGLSNRGLLQVGSMADIIVFDLKNYSANADFSHWNKLSSGVEHVIVNGIQVIESGEFNRQLPGKVLTK